MSYHGQATRLIAGGNWAELNSMLRELDATIAAKDAEIAGLTAANAEIARLREVLSVIAYPLNIGKVYHMDAVTQARAALATVEGVGK